MPDGVVDGPHRVARVAVARGVHEPEHHDLGALGDARHADAVIPRRADDPCNVRPVAVFVHRIGIVGAEIVAV